MNHSLDPIRPEEYADFIENAPIACYSMGANGLILQVNQTWLRWLGYAREEAEDKLYFRDLLHPQDQPRFDEGFARLKEEGRIDNLQLTLARKDGGLLHGIGGATAVTDPAGRFLRSRGFFLDLTQQMKDRQSAALLFDATPDAMVITDGGGRIARVNTQAERVFGYARAELVGQPVDLLLPAELRERHGAHRAHYGKSPHVRAMGSGMDLQAQRRDGTRFPVEVSLSPIATEEGLLIAAAIRDISERQRMEAGARQLTERLLDAVESVQDAFALFDEGDRLALCNSAFRVSLGQPFKGGIQGRGFAEILSEVLRDGPIDPGPGGALALMERWTAYHQRPEGALDLRTTDGQSWRVIERRTSEGGRVMTIWDLSDDVRREAELAEARGQAEAASASKSEFLSSMSHELRTPLNAILGFAQLLQRDRREPLSPRHRDMLKHVLKSGEHLLQLIDEVLDLSRIEAGRLTLSPEPVEVVSVLQEVREALGPQSASARVAFLVAPTPPDLPLLRADRTRLRQILINYGSNAIKYGRQGGRAELFCSLRPGWVRVSLRDNGPGIPADQQDRIFQAFFRAGQETGPIEGTGIGLTICKRLAEAMGSHVGFSSTVGAGSEFWIDLPVEERSARQVVAAVPAESGGRRTLSDGPRMRVLYVEDNPSNLALMQEVMAEFDRIELLSAPSAERGIELALTCAPNLILMDINLPGMSGYDALVCLKEHDQTRHIPVFAVSASAMDRDQRRALEAGFQRFLAKPLNLDDLIAALESVLI